MIRKAASKGVREEAKALDQDMSLACALPVPGWSNPKV